MRQMITTLVLGVVGAWIAQWLTEIQEAAQKGTFLKWITNFSNGDVLALIQILLICYVYAKVREIQKTMPPPNHPRPFASRIFGF